MMKEMVLLSALFLGTGLYAAENLLTNGDFGEGTTGWWSGMSAAMKAAGGRQGVEENHWVAVIPDTGESESPGALVGHSINLGSGKTYRLAYTLSVEKGGTMRQLYQMSRKPYHSLGLEENVPVEPGTTDISATFQCSRPADTPAHITFNLSNLKGKVCIDNVRLEEAVRLPVSALSKQWTVFSDVTAPVSFSAVPAVLAGTKGVPTSPAQASLDETGVIDVAKLNGGRFRPRARALLFNEFTSPAPGAMEIGFSANGWMAIRINGKEILNTPKAGSVSGKLTPNDHVVDLPVQEGKNVLAVEVLSGANGWSLLCGAPEPPVTYVANGEWKAVNMSCVQVQEGSALDLSALVDKPAGKQGRVMIGEGGDLVFAAAPSQPVRMLGFNGFPSEIWKESDGDVFRSKVKLFAEAARRQGYSLFRVHGLLDRTLCEGATEDMSIRPDKLDRWDFLLSQLKREGIYCHLVIFSFGLYERSAVDGTTFTERDKHKLQLYLGGEWERKRFRYGAETILNHVNPYTGLAWKNDPAIAFVEFYNEQELGLDRMGKTISDFPDAKAYLEREWRKWLCARHGTHLPPALAAELKGKSLDAAPLPSLDDRTSELANEFALFRMHVSAECAKWCERVVRDTGYEGLTTQYNASKKIGDSAVRWQVSQVVDMHAYYQHPIGGWGTAGNIVKQDSSLADAAGYWRSANSTRLSGRPFIVSEFNHCFWNPYQHECGVVFGAYSSLQGFSALEIHSGPVTLEVGSPKVASFTCAASPVVRASEFLSGCLYRRGDVTRAQKRVELVVPEQVLNRGAASLGGVSTEQSRLGLMTGFSLSFPWAERMEKTTGGGRADLRLLPAGVAAVNAQDWFVDVVESKDGDFSMADTVRKMKTVGILNPGNISDPENGVFQSDTGEITMRSREHLLKVKSPCSEAVTLEANKRETVGALAVERSSVAACVAVCSATAEPIAVSGRMVLLYSTEMVNTGMVVGPDREMMKDTGKGPALMRCGKLSVTLTCKDPEHFSLYALGFDGGRREKLPVSVAGGRLQIQIDVATLADGPTPFFELVRN